MAYLRKSFTLFIMLSLITGVVYPLAVTGLAQAIFPHRANGSIVRLDGRPIGSELIGQPFSSRRYFLSRPSATSPSPYNASLSGGSNLALTNPELIKRVKARLEVLSSGDAQPQAEPVPQDLVTSSASGLDPHISLAAAVYQLPRVAAARGMEQATLERILERHTERPFLGFLGEPRVNVLLLNLALDAESRPK